MKKSQMAWKCVEHSFHLILIEFETHRLHFYQPTWQSGGMLIAMSQAIACIHDKFQSQRSTSGGQQARQPGVCFNGACFIATDEKQLSVPKKSHKKFHKCHVECAN